ncbi:hypothetical protein Clacol_007527 [Clathrus columnatus]|uniref:Uncharacterized protein n=1 Tax=Clathrus columnatus TaxID=1419009 RepID=A0AAV5AF54_9AGAM|nr:hypothetical protein Clacol_007527 [Clathrus columnatus]
MSLLGGCSPRVRGIVSKSLNRRRLHDVVTFGPGYKPTISYGPPGRAADTGHVATVFGCTGFLGRYLVHKLAKAGTKVVIPYREEDNKRHLKVMGDLGQVVSLEWDIRSEEQTAECVRHSDIVYNLVGRDYETKNFTYEDVNVTGAERIARISAECGVPRLVHISHINADILSPSIFYRTKAEGEERVRKQFPNASIVRPGSMFGYEDRFLNSIAGWPMWWRLNDGETTVRPVHVLDVAQALHNLIDIPPQSEVFSLPGPRTYTYEHMLDLVSSVTCNPVASGMAIPKPLAILIARVAQLAWWPMISPDEVERKYISDKPAEDVHGDWEKLGVEPEPLELHAIKFLRRYRTVENFDRPSGTGQSLTALIATEDALVKQAALALPHSFDKCTYELGPIRQAVHLCLTCGIPQGLCSACSVACHGDHEQVELFPKRDFICDCPTRVGNTDCTLSKGSTLPKNMQNAYGQNFYGKFCRCHRPYDPKREQETMVQCLVCEDWFHESCLNLRTRPKERDVNGDPDVPSRELQTSVIDVNSAANMNEPVDGTDTDSECSNDLPPCLLPASEYDTLICGSCVLANATLRRWAGTEGILMVYSDDPGCKKELSLSIAGDIDPRWKVLNGRDAEEIVIVEGDTEAEDCRPTKRRRTEEDITNYATSICIAPLMNPIAQLILTGSEKTGKKLEVDSNQTLLGHGDIFLTEGWRDRWCKCPKCLPPLKCQPCLLEEETTYEPPEDPDSGMTLEQLGMRALSSLPRDRAIDGILAYNTMRDELISYLRPFAQEGRIVREEDIRCFFESKREQ